MKKWWLAGILFAAPLYGAPPVIPNSTSPLAIVLIDPTTGVPYSATSGGTFSPTSIILPGFTYAPGVQAGILNAPGIAISGTANQQTAFNNTNSPLNFNISSDTVIAQNGVVGAPYGS